MESEQEKGTAAPETRQPHSDCLPFHGGFRNPGPIQGFESGSEQTYGTRCYKQPDPELLLTQILREISGLISVADSVIPNGPD